MRNPDRKALYCLLALLVAAGLAGYGIARQDALEEDWRPLAALLLAFAILPFPLYILVEALFALRGRALLLAGHKVIARWRVDPAEWARFRGFDGRRAAGDPDLVNPFRVRRATPPAGVDVIVGEVSLLVDGSYHGLRPGGLPALRGVGWIEGSPACLELSLAYPRSRYGGIVRTTLRVPVPAAARAAGVRVHDHYAALVARRPPPFS